MGKYKQGILGAFSGKVGTVVGSFWKSRWVMRGLAPNIHNPQTPAQMTQRQRFELINRWISPILGFINLGFGPIARANSVTPGNVYSSVNLDDPNVIQGTYPNQTIDYTALNLSQGQGINPESPSVAQGTGHTLAVTWTDNTGVSPETISSDIIMCAVINPARGTAVYDTQNASRLDASLIIAYPALWAGEELHVYIAARNSADTLVAPSLHVGSIVCS